MTLDEAITYTEKVAEENQRVVDTGIVFNDVTIDMLYCDDTEVIEEHLANYQKCAEEQRQLAEWLKELKQLREQTRWIPVSEELPDKEGYYLCSVRYMYPPYNFFEPEKVKYMDDVTIQKFDGEFNIEVTAWMPLPLPWEGE